MKDVQNNIMKTSDPLYKSSFARNAFNQNKSTLISKQNTSNLYFGNESAVKENDDLKNKIVN